MHGFTLAAVLLVSVSTTCAQDSEVLLVGLMKLDNGRTVEVKLDPAGWQNVGEVETEVRGRGLVELDDATYVCTYLNDAHQFGTIDPLTGQYQEIGPTGIVGDPSWASLLHDGLTGKFYFSTHRVLYGLDPATGVASQIGSYDFSPLDSMTAVAIDDTGEAYGVDFGLIDQSVDLYRIDLKTAKLTHLGDLPYSTNYYSAMAFHPDGRLIAGRSEGQIWEIDIATVKDKQLSAGIAGSWDGMDFVDVGGCYADCDNDGGASLFDFLCFVNAFNDGDPYADCVADGFLDLFDFLCFTNAFNVGC